MNWRISPRCNRVTNLLIQEGVCRLRCRPTRTEAGIQRNRDPRRRDGRPELGERLGSVLDQLRAGFSGTRALGAASPWCGWGIDAEQNDAGGEDKERKTSGEPANRNSEEVSRFVRKLWIGFRAALAKSHPGHIGPLLRRRFMPAICESDSRRSGFVPDETRWRSCRAQGPDDVSRDSLVCRMCGLACHGCAFERDANDESGALADGRFEFE